MVNTKSMHVISWILLNYFATLTFQQQQPPTAVPPTAVPPTAVPPSPKSKNNDQWCVFCRSDTNPACLNNAEAKAGELTRQCTNETLHEFYSNFKHNPPRRPATKPRAGYDPEWVCYSVKAADGSFTFRTCSLSPGTLLGEDECVPCEFDNAAATCCTCVHNNCNVKNSDATFLFKEPVVTLINGVICGVLVLLYMKCSI